MPINGKQIPRLAVQVVALSFFFFVLLLQRLINESRAPRNAIASRLMEGGTNKDDKPGITALEYSLKDWLVVGLSVYSMAGLNEAGLDKAGLESTHIQLLMSLLKAVYRA